MKIVHVLTRLLRAGSEENTMATALWQVEHGHSVSILHGREYDDHWSGKYGDRIEFLCEPKLVHPISPAMDYAAYRAMTKLFRERNPDVVHTHQSKAGIVGRAAARHLSHTAVVHGLHIVNFDGVSVLKRQIYLASERLARRWTDQFIAVSSDVADAYANAGVADREAIQVVYSGMDIERFRMTEWPDDAANLAGGARVVLLLAAFEPRKRHLELIEELGRRDLKDRDFVLLLAGEGPMRVMCEQRVDELGLKDRVQFCGFREDPEKLIALADLCLIASIREGLPRVAVQYIAGGKPVVASHLRGIEEILTHGRNAIVAGSEISDVVTSMLDLLDDPERLVRLNDGARETDVSRWSFDVLGRETTSLYEERLSAGP